MSVRELTFAELMLVAGGNEGNGGDQGGTGSNGGGDGQGNGASGSVGGGYGFSAGQDDFALGGWKEKVVEYIATTVFEWTAGQLIANPPGPHNTSPSLEAGVDMSTPAMGNTPVDGYGYANGS